MMMMMMMLQGGQSFTYISLLYSEYRALFLLAQSSRAVLCDVKAKYLPQYLSEEAAQCSGRLYSEKKMTSQSSCAQKNRTPYPRIEPL